MRLCQWSGHEQLLIDLEGHGREDLFDDIDLSRTVGWFTSLYPVLLQPRGEIGSALKRVKEGLRRVPNRGVGYGVLKYLGTAESRARLSSLPSRQVLFNYLGQFDSSFDEQAPWTPASEQTGSAVDGSAPRAHEFSVSGQIFENELRLIVGYSRQRHRRESVQAWVNLFSHELDALISHCAKGFRGVTPSDFPLAQLSQSDLDALPARIQQAEALYSTTALQHGLLFHSVRDAGSGAYVNQLRVDIEGLDAGRFAAAWQAVLSRHEVLRSGFLHERAVPLQWVKKDVPVSLVEQDWRERKSLTRDLQALAESQRTEPFDLAHPPLMRFALVRVEAQRHHFIWTHHHLLSDGWSTAQVIGEVMHHYHHQSLPALGGRYRDYIQWLQSRDVAASEAYWKLQLRAVEEPTRLASALPSEGSGEGYGEHEEVLEAALTERLERFAQQERVTLNTLVQAAWALLLNRYTGQPCVTFGATSAGRPAELPGVESLVGLFINTFPVICQVDAGERIGEWLRQLQGQNLASREHEHTALYEIQRWSGAGSQGLFDSLLVFENYPVDERLREGASERLRFSGVHQHERTHYPLTVVVGHTQQLSLRYSSLREHFSDATVKKIAAQMRSVLEQLTDGAQRRVGEITLLNAEERTQLDDWSAGIAQYATGASVHELFAQQAERHPQATALTFQEESLNYAQLDARANRLAHALMKRGVRPEVRVGVALERSVDLVVSLLAVLKAGGAYVPLDPAYPVERLDYMMRDSGIALLLTHSELAATLPQVPGIETLTVDTLDVSTEPSSDPEVRLHPQNLAYVIYTSGSTGRPKGAQLCHGNVARLLHATQAWFGFDERDVWTLFHSYAFDFSVWELFGALCYGGQVVVVPYEVSRSPEQFAQLLREKQVTVLNQTPSAFRQLMQVPGLYECQDLALRTVIFGGEGIGPAHPASLDGAFWRAQPAAHQHVRHHRDDGARDVPTDPRRRCARYEQSDW